LYISIVIKRDVNKKKYKNQNRSYFLRTRDRIYITIQYLIVGRLYYILRSVITPIPEYIGIRLRKKKHTHMLSTALNSSGIRGGLAASVVLLVTPRTYTATCMVCNTYFIIKYKIYCRMLVVFTI